MEDPDQYTRVIATTVLGMIGNTEGLEEALSGTMSKDRTIPLVSVQALGLIGDERALPRLEEIARDPKACCPDHVLLAGESPAERPRETRLELLREGILDSSHRSSNRRSGCSRHGHPEAVALLARKRRT